MYYNHFGLSQAPFKITPNTEFFFSGGNRGPILEALIYAITHGEGIIKVTGEVGSGKTMLCHMLPTRLPPHIEIVYIANPSVSPEEILHAIAFELQLPVERGAQRLAVMQALHDFLVKRFAEGKRVVVFVEESQSMPLATLEEIRLLSNLETKNDKLLQIVLFGQPELDDNLRQPNIRQLRERITHSFRLEPFTQAEVREYLMFRMRAAGYRGPDLFSSAVVRTIARSSLGLTRRINLIADKALLAAFSENTHTVKGKHVDAAVRDSEFSQTVPDRAEPARLWRAAALVATGAAAGIALYAIVQEPPQSHPGPRIMATPAEAGSAAAAPAPEPSAATRDAAESREPSTASGTEARGPAVAPAPAPRPEQAVSPAARVPAAAVKPPAGSAKAAPAKSGGEVASNGAGKPAGTQPAAGGDLLESRLAATERWLAGEAQGNFSIQLMGTNDPEQLREHLNALSKFIEINKVFVYRTKAKQKPSITVLYGSFSSPRAAREALDKLPQSLRANHPILRTVQGIRAEIKQYQTS